MYKKLSIPPKPPHTAVALALMGIEKGKKRVQMDVGGGRADRAFRTHFFDFPSTHQ